MLPLLPEYFNIRGNGLVPSFFRFAYFVLKVLFVEVNSSTSFQFSVKRILVFICTTFTLVSLLVWNHAGFLLDDFFFPEWRTQPVECPLFLIGNARSGTTWLHRLITHNADNFTSLKTWEILFAVSITWRWCFHALFLVDRCFFCSAGYALVLALDKSLFGSIKVHPIGLMEAEEDEWLMVYICMSQLILFFYPLGGAVLDPIINFDFSPSGNDSDLLNVAIRRQVFQYYKECVQRHLYYITHYPSNTNSKYKGTADQRALIFVSKNPAFTLRIESIYEAFPTARIVCLLRDPMQSIPSMISYISIVWRTFANPIQKYPNAKDLLGFCEAHYLYPLDHLTPDKHPVFQWAFISYHHLVADLKDEVIKLLNRLYGSECGGNTLDGTALISKFKEFVPFLEAEQRRTSKWALRCGECL